MPSPSDSTENDTDFISKNSPSCMRSFEQIKELVALRNQQPLKSQYYISYQERIDTIYNAIRKVLIHKTETPNSPVKFGTSGWRGIIGDDIFCHSVAVVTQAIVEMFQNIDTNQELATALEVKNFDEVKTKGCVLGFDNRFGNELLAMIIIDVLTSQGIAVLYAGESSTGLLSASVLQHNAAFSINLTPSHNPLEYAGFKFNGADAGPASAIITEEITRRSALFYAQKSPLQSFVRDKSLVQPIRALQDWIALTKTGEKQHGLDYEMTLNNFIKETKLCIAVDCVHGASRVDIKEFFKGFQSDRLTFIRTREDTTFGGIAPEPSTTNMIPVVTALTEMSGPLKLGVIMDPDADRIRFTDGTSEISMNCFGAMAYHYLHEKKHKSGLVAKTVATSNFANAIADALKEKVFEPKVGFKEFKPVIGEALVCFEESDGITVIGHTPEKDAYIGLLLAMEMTLDLQMNLGEYLLEIQKEFGYFYPEKDGVEVSQKGMALQNTLSQLSQYSIGTPMKIGQTMLTISEIIDIDGYKFIFEDQSWLMIRASGTEPKVRFYVEARSKQQKEELFDAAKTILKELGLI